MTGVLCKDPACTNEANFWYYSEGTDEWTPVCASHAEQLHPSTEIKTWLFSGLMKPIELGEPTNPPDEPQNGREAAFREEIRNVMHWDE